MGRTFGVVLGVGAGILFAATCQLRPDPHASLAKPEAPAPAPAPISSDTTAATPATTEAPDALFLRTVRPILAERCAPCHNPGGSMYARLPFDDPKTVADHRSGIVKRIKKEQERAAMEQWLLRVPAQAAAH
jgi:hypothetical protein